MSDLVICLSWEKRSLMKFIIDLPLFDLAIGRKCKKHSEIVMASMIKIAHITCVLKFRE